MAQVWIWMALCVSVAMADLPPDICIRGGTTCASANLANPCNAAHSYCCSYPNPVANSIRCFCKPGYAGEKCNIKLEDPDWFDDAQEDLEAVISRKLNQGTAKNVILFLGDGMGIATVTSARILLGQRDGKAGEESKFKFESFPYTGFSKTYVANHQVTDSAGAASSIFSGRKSNYGTVGVNSNVIRYDCEKQNANKVDTLLDWSQQAGKRTGVVTTTRVTHATPASMYAHSAERSWECDSDLVDNWGNNWNTISATEHDCKDIAWQFVNTSPGNKLNVLMGGGRAKFLPDTMNDPEYPTKQGSRSDGHNLPEEWKKMHEDAGKTAKYVWKKSDLDAAPDTTDHIFGLFERSHMRYNYDNKNDNGGEPTLEEMVEKAIKVLNRGDKGFFLLVEGGRIDHGHHAGQAKRALDETIAMDKAVQKALSMTDEKDTLITVTADHSHTFTIGGYTGRGNDIFGNLDSHDVEPSLDGFPRTTLAYVDGKGAPNRTARTDPVPQDSYDYLQQAMVLTTEESHGGEDVPIYANGPMAHLLTGVHDQIYIAHALAYASCVGSNKKHCDHEHEEPSPCSASGMSQNALVMLVMVLAVCLFGR